MYGVAMMWQISSGSYYNRINEPVPYGFYLEKAKACIQNPDYSDPSIAERLEYIDDISRVSSPSMRMFTSSLSCSHSHALI